MSVWVIVLLIGTGVLVLAGLIIGLVFLIISLVQLIGGTTGGLRRLAESYPATIPRSGQVMQRETVKIGAVVYKRCVTLGVSDAGLYVATWGKSALIPWAAFTGIGHATLYWQKVPLLTVGDPPVATITLPVAVFDLMRSRLPETLQDGS